MVAVTTLPYSRPLTRADLASVPDDGHRYELIDGSLLVTPAPTWRHQEVLGGLFACLHASCPPDLVTLLAPFAVVLADDTEVQPDLFVARRVDMTQAELTKPPLLVVEVLSPSTRRIDLLLKRSRFAASGIPSYWIVDPLELSLQVLTLDGREYVEVAHVSGEQSFSTITPFDVTVVPARLVSAQSSDR